MIYLSKNSSRDHLCQVGEISQALDSPEPFTAKILQQLTKVDLLMSMKGKNGGFTLGRAPEKIKICDIVVSIDGEKAVKKCILGLRDCSSENPCPLHHKYYKIKSDIRDNILNVDLLYLKDTLKTINLQ